MTDRASTQAIDAYLSEGTRRTRFVASSALLGKLTDTCCSC